MANNLANEKKILVVSMLSEGNSIRAIERVTGVNRNTIMSLGLRMGDACTRIHDGLVRNLGCRQIQIDEIWGFIRKKRKHLKPGDEFKNFGDCWTYIALDRESKLIPAYRVGIRSVTDAQAFIEDLASRLIYRVQLSSDQLPAYQEAVERGFDGEVDYGQIVKIYDAPTAGKDAASRYSPGECISVTKRVMVGEPRISLICTSHVEKQNHTLRMHSRRLTRLTNGFSKKLENFKAATALNFVYYNFCKRHIAVKATPAQAAGIAEKQWTVAELVERSGE
jgi:IS1 family transposase